MNISWVLTLCQILLYVLKTLTHLTFIYSSINTYWAFAFIRHRSGTSQVVLAVKNSPANAGDIRDLGLIPELGGSPGGRNGNPLQYSSIESPVDRGPWWATVYRVAKSWTRVKGLNTQTRRHCLRSDTQVGDICLPGDTGQYLEMCLL